MEDLKKYRSYLKDYLEKYHDIKSTNNFFRCLSPNHIDNNPSMKFTEKYNICKCFSCGTYYDIFSLVGLDYNLNTFKEQLDKIKELYDSYTPVDNSKCDNNYKVIDYRNYYIKCKKNINKTNYLNNRGISDVLISKYDIGFCEKNNSIIFPITDNCYFARSVINDSKYKNKYKSELWNNKYLRSYNQEDIVYITESIIDSLSLEMIDPNIKTISINGTGNINQLLNKVKENKFNGNIVIAFDNDLSGNRASKILKSELDKLNITNIATSLIYNFDSDKCKDINEALLVDKNKLLENYNYINDNFREYTINIIKEEDIISEL